MNASKMTEEALVEKLSTLPTSEAVRLVNVLVARINDRCNRAQCCPNTPCVGQFSLEHCAPCVHLPAYPFNGGGVLKYTARGHVKTKTGKSILPNTVISKYEGVTTSAHDVNSMPVNSKRRRNMIQLATQEGAPDLYLVPVLAATHRPELSNFPAFVKDTNDALPVKGRKRQAEANCYLFEKNQMVWLMSKDKTIDGDEELLLDFMPESSADDDKARA